MPRSFHRYPYLLVLVLIGCGSPDAPKGASLDLSLSPSPEQLDQQPASSRQEQFRELARLSISQAGRVARGPVVFPLLRQGELVAAPGLDPRADLLQATDAGQTTLLIFETRPDRWPEDRRVSLQGLSEKEAADLVARALLSLWGVQPSGPVQVDRALGAPYAAAYIDGILRINPSFVYLAASIGAP